MIKGCLLSAFCLIRWDITFYQLSSKSSSLVRHFARNNGPATSAENRAGQARAHMLALDTVSEKVKRSGLKKRDLVAAVWKTLQVQYRRKDQSSRWHGPPFISDKQMNLFRDTPVRRTIYCWRYILQDVLHAEACQCGLRKRDLKLRSRMGTSSEVQAKGVQELRKHDRKSLNSRSTYDLIDLALLPLNLHE
jgi:hypothetical protein